MANILLFFGMFYDLFNSSDNSSPSSEKLIDCTKVENCSNVTMENILLFSGYSDSLLKFASISCFSMMVVGISGNLLTIISFYCTKKEMNATAVFIVNLSISDLLFDAFNLPLAAGSFWTRRWTHGVFLCRLYPVMRYGLVAVSLFTILGITFNRYIMISHPNLYPTMYTKRNLIVMVSLTWICAFSTLIPTWFGKWGRFGLDYVIGSCSILADDTGYNPKEFLFIVAFLIPCICIATCYARIFYIVRNTARRSHMTNRSTLTAPVTAASVVTTASGKRASAASCYSFKSKRLPQVSTDDSAIGSSNAPSSSTDKSTSANEQPLDQNVPGTCANLLSPPIPLSYRARVLADPSSSSGLEEEFAEELPTSRSVTPTSVGGQKKTIDGAGEKRPSAVNITLNQMASAIRRSPMNLRSRRQSMPSQPGKMTSKDRKLLQMILVIFTSFVVCYLPITVVKTSHYLSDFHEINIISYLLLYLTTCINPFIYVVMSSEYRQAYKRVLLWPFECGKQYPN